MKLRHFAFFGFLSIVIHLLGLIGFTSSDDKALIQAQAGQTALVLGQAFDSRAVAAKQAEPIAEKPVEQPVSQPVTPVQQPLQAVKQPIQNQISDIQIQQPVKQQPIKKVAPKMAKPLPPKKIEKPKPKPKKIVKPKPKPKPKPKKIVKPKVEPKPKPKPKKVAKVKPVQPVKPAPVVASTQPAQKAKTSQAAQPQSSKGGDIANPQGHKSARGGAGGRSAQPGGQAERSNYRGEVIARLKRHKRYPRRAQRRRQTGTATISFDLFSNGKAGPVSLIESSGYKSLDKEAIAMVSRSVPFKPFPSDISEKQMSFKIPVVFNLR